MKFYDTKIISQSRRACSDIWSSASNRDKIPIVYFNQIDNVGDLLNEYLIPLVSGKNIIKVSGNAVSHMRAIGSLLGSTSSKSIIWGAGSIDGRPPARKLNRRNVLAVRGKLTKQLIESTGISLSSDLPLGDPAVITPSFYMPKSVKTTKIGVVPHFIDEKRIESLKIIENPDCKIISVRQPPERFIDELISCEFVLSTSLHGLILADVYKIPNKWIKVSDDLLGGTYKFNDYYSTTDHPKESPIPLASNDEVATLISSVAREAHVKHYTKEVSSLIAAFPKKFMHINKEMKQFRNS